MLPRPPVVCVQASPDWQALLGPPVTPRPGPDLALLQHVTACLSQLEIQGALPASDLPLAVQLVDSLLRHSGGSIRDSRPKYHKPGVLAGSVLVLVSAARGRYMEPAAAAAAVQAAGLEAGPQAIQTQLLMLRKQWQVSRGR